MVALFGLTLSIFYNAMRTMSKKTPERTFYNAPRPRYLFYMSLLCTVIILLGGAFALLRNAALPFSQPASFAYPAKAAPAHFDDMSVVGPPSLSADTVNAIFERLGSPMSGTGKIVEQMSQQTNIDDAFALGVWWTETNDGAAGVGLADRNPGSVRGSVGYPSAYDGYTIYPGYTDAIVYWFHMLRNQYVDRGLATVYAISYPYVGTSSSPLWAGKVIALMLRYRGEAPPPTPVPTLIPSPTFSPNLPHHRPITFGSDTRPAPAAVQPYEQQDALANSTQPAPLGLPFAMTWVIVLFALLLALAIALSAVKFLPAIPAIPAQGLYTWSRAAPVAILDNQDRAGIHPIPTLRLPSTPMPAANPASLFTHLPETPGVGKIRRTILLPPEQGDVAPGDRAGAMEEIGRRPTGLLARYGQSQQQ